MRYGPDDKFWVVTDPTPESETADILFQASLAEFEGRVIYERLSKGKHKKASEGG